MHIFLDESGQFSDKGREEFFVVASFTVGNPKRTAKDFKKWCSSKFPKMMRGQGEIKWSSTSIDKKLRFKTLAAIAKMDVRIRYTYLHKGNIPNTYRPTPTSKLESGLLYTNIIGELVEMYLPPNDCEIHIVCDQRQLKGLTQMQFKNLLRGRLLPNAPKGTIITIDMVDSASNPNIQIADWIVGAIACFHEAKQDGDIHFELLKNNLLQDGRELFQSKLQL